MQVIGDIGRLKVGYKYAATLRNWNVTYDHTAIGSPETILVGRVVEINDYWITQRPITVGLFMGRSWWVWRESQVVDIGHEAHIKLVGSPIALPDF